MKRYIFLCILLAGLMMYLHGQGADAGTTVKIVKLQYISPGELRDNLISQYTFDKNNEIIINGNSVHITFNDAVNQVMLTGSPASIADAMEVIEFLDVPPRQIVITAKIVEIDNEKLSELGTDWQTLLDNTSLHGSLSFNKQRDKSDGLDIETEGYIFQGYVSNYMGLGTFLKIIQEKNAGRIIKIPQIVTTNNKKGTVLDGYRVTYVARYSSYANIYETQEMTAGLFLSVIPSLGESGYLKLTVTAKLTKLGAVIAGSPAETGQIIENTIIVKDGEEFILGGFKMTEKSKQKRKVPILGTILPFLFSRTKEIETSKDFLIILKPTIIDLKPLEIPEID